MRRSRGSRRTTRAPGRVYFVGFAGYGEERVFAEEIKLAAQRRRREIRLLAAVGAAAQRPARPDDLAARLGLLAALHAQGARARHGPGRGRAVSRVVVARLARRDHRGVERGHDAADLERARRSRDAARGVRHPLEGDRDLGVFLRHVRASRSPTITPSSSRPPRATAARSAARTRGTSPTSARRSSRTRCRYSTYLRVAFESTRKEIRRREREEGVTASNPQGSFGKLMEEKLRAIEQARAPQYPPIGQRR